MCSMFVELMDDMERTVCVEVRIEWEHVIVQSREHWDMESEI